MRSSTSSSFSFAALAAAALLSLGSSAYAQSACNGHSELCSRSYSNISYVGAHNSYGVLAGSIASNQNYDVTTQLSNGVRLLQNQGHSENGDIHLCHTSCLLLDAGTVTDYLGKVKAWLDENPNEVISILWVNSDNLPVAQWAQAYTANGLDTMSYVPSSTPVAYSAWPTLQELISSGKRVISFMDYGADYSSVNYILDHFTHFWETPYDSTDDTFPCTVDRGEASTKMYMINHYLDKNLTFFSSQIPVPDTAQLNTTNGVSGAGSLGQNAEQCASEHGQYPTFLLVDFYDVGDGSVFEVAADLNSVQYTAGQIGNGTKIKSSAGSGSSSGSSNSSSRSSGISGTGSSSNDTGAGIRNVVGSVVLPLVMVMASLVVFA